MKRVFTFLKSWLKKILPESNLNYLKGKRYYSSVKNFDIEQEPDLKLSKKIIKLGDKVIDVGANIGVYTKYMSEFIGPSGNIFSFEPIKITYDFLNNNIGRLKLNNVQSYNYALSDKTEKKTMVIPVDTAGGNYFRAMITEDKIKIANTQSYEVSSIKLDEILDNFVQYSFIKIDVEGHEESVLKGAKKIIKFSKPIFLIEIDGNLADITSSAGRVYSFLVNLGYDTFVNKNQKLAIWEEGIYSINYFFIHKDSLAKLTNENLFSK